MQPMNEKQRILYDLCKNQGFLVGHYVAVVIKETGFEVWEYDHSLEKIATFKNGLDMIVFVNGLIRK